jgi:hypothetical protein
MSTARAVVPDLSVAAIKVAVGRVAEKLTSLSRQIVRGPDLSR